MSLQLLAPGKIGDLTINNRVALAPLTRGRSGENRVPNDLLVKYYTDRASAGLIITEGTHPSPQGTGWKDSPSIWNKDHVEGWRRVIDSVHEKGGVIFCQFWHMGRAAHSSFYPDVVAPSAIAITGEGMYTADGTKQPHEVPRALTVEDIAEIITNYGNAAQCAKDAGFDGIEIHGANGYLIDEFLQSVSNHRTDQYGGSIENRFRFLGEILDKVTEIFPSHRVGVRISPNGNYNSMGSEDNIETFSEVIRQLSLRNLAYLHIMDGLSFGFHSKTEPFTLDLARSLYPGTIIANCGYTRDTAEAAVAAGKADLVSFGRPYLANPDLVERFANNWPLAELPYNLWFSHAAEGYVDQKPYDPTTAKDETTTVSA